MYYFCSLLYLPVPIVIILKLAWMNHHEWDVHIHNGLQSKNNKSIRGTLNPRCENVYGIVRMSFRFLPPSPVCSHGIVPVAHFSMLSSDRSRLRFGRVLTRDHRSRKSPPSDTPLSSRE